jgi:NADPH-dependent 2,4-dienoyl-CoA reductase/sulfur reductase-like enzyme
MTEKELKDSQIDLLLESVVVHVDSAQKFVRYRKQNEEWEIAYDKLIIATGSSQVSQKIRGSESEHVLTYKWRDEATETLNKIDASQHVTIIGGGQVGIEMADLLRQKGKQVALVENMDYVLFKYFDKEMIQPIQTKMRAVGVNLYLNQTVSSIDENKNNINVQLSHEKIASDTAILAVNVRPDLQFLDQHIQLHMDHTIAVDEYLQTSVQDVFAVGDVVQLSFGAAERESFYGPLVNNAARTGVTVANNLLQPTMSFNGSLRTIGTYVFGYYIASTGMTESESAFSHYKVDVKKQTVPINSLPDAPTITLKYVYEKESQVLLGAQLFSKANVLEKINTLALAIQTKQTFEELKQKEFFFHPAFTPVIETTNMVVPPNLGSDCYED